MWVVLGVWAVVGLGVGFFIAKLRKVGIALIGTFGGVLLGFMITTTFVVGSTALTWVIVLGCGIAVGFLAFFVEKAVIIIVTSFVGSYGVIRGISMYAGGFPNEMQLKQEI